VRVQLHAVIVGLALAGPTVAQPPTPQPLPVPLLPEPAQPPADGAAPPAPAAPDRPDPTAALNKELLQNARELDLLKARQPTDAQEAERLRKQVDLLQKQIEVLQKMATLLADQVKKNEGQAATLDARSVQAARRDQTLAATTDDLRESADAQTRTNPYLPSTLHELFNLHRNNESPLGIYGTLSSQFVKFQDRPSNFPTTVFSPHFYLLLNEQFMLEANPEIEPFGEINLESAQLDWFLHDNLTAVFGRFYSPLGFFNERLHTTWVFKTPDKPLLFNQVFPSLLSMNGVMLRGAMALGCSPFKLEYAGVVTNGFSLTTARPTAQDFANLAEMSDAFNDVNGDKAVGGRVGLSVPAYGLVVGLSGLLNGAYDQVEGFDLNVVDADFGWHYGNWDVRSEFARTNQEAPGGVIHRRGYYAQVAYRPYDCCHYVLQRLEGVFRFDYVRFGGIDPAVAALNFGSRELAPIGRNRYTFGLNYYPYPSLIVKVAYEINDEVQFRDRQDNGFIAQVAWGF
jgi:hypothetical protein